MTSAHTEMHETYRRINAMWPKPPPVITRDDRGKVAELFRWCRDRLGGRDQDLVGPERWQRACREGWSPEATYACLPSRKPGQTWPDYVHDVAHWLWLILPAKDGYLNYEVHALGHARLELELTELVVGWFADEVRGVRRSFEPLALSRPPDMRQSAEGR